MELSDLNKDKRSLLLFFESAAVDQGGILQSSKLSDDDISVARRWSESGLVQFGRIAFGDIKIPTTGSDRHSYTHWVVLSDEAWRLAHEERRARAARLEAKLTVERLGYQVNLRLEQKGAIK